MKQIRLSPVWYARNRSAKFICWCPALTISRKMHYMIYYVLILSMFVTASTCNNSTSLLCDPEMIVDRQSEYRLWYKVFQEEVDFITINVTLKLAAHWATRPDTTGWSWSYWVVNVSVHGLKIRPDSSLSRVVRSEHVQLSRLAIESGFIMCDSKSAVASFKPTREESRQLFDVILSWQ